MAQPDLIPMPFAENATPGTIEPIPATTPTVPQDATWSAGFPQVTMQPLASGGIPPRGQNFNGVLNALSQHIFHMQGGGQYKWDTAHGPYSIGDVLQSDDGLRSYVSAVDNNTDNFNTTPGVIGTSWLPWSGGTATELIAGLMKIATTAQAQALTADNAALTPKKLADAFKGANQSTGSITSGLFQLLPGGFVLQFGSVAAGASAPRTVTLPIAVPGGLYAAVATVTHASTPTNNTASVTNPAAGSFTVTTIDAATGVTQGSGFRWILLGYLGV